MIVMRYGQNALETLRAVKSKTERAAKNAAAGRRDCSIHDRSTLIEESVKTLTHKLLEEFAVVVLVCALFLFHLRSALVAMVSLPLGGSSVLLW